jgi:hypothetical protein
MQGVVKLEFGVKALEPVGQTGHGNIVPGAEIFQLHPGLPAGGTYGFQNPLSKSKRHFFSLTRQVPGDNL